MSYATLNTQFNLPPPPPRNIFSSVHDDAGRAWFPDFTKEQDPVDALKLFIKDLFYAHLRKSTFVQLKLLSCLVAVVGISISLIILRRLWEKSFWLFRLARRSNGTLIVPNCITSFVAIESMFAVSLISLCWEIMAWYEYGQSPKYLVLWIGLTWMPLILGAWFCTVGVAHARPNAFKFLSPQPGKPPSWTLRMGVTPAFANIFVFVVPVVQSVTVIIPAVLAQQHFGRAFDHYLRWSAAIQPGQELSRDLLLEAQQIWFEVLDAAYLISVCMAVWATWVCSLFFIYCWAGGSLITMVRRQIADLKSFQQKRSFNGSSDVHNGDTSNAPLPPAASPNIVVSSVSSQRDIDVEKQLPTSKTGTSKTGGIVIQSMQTPLRSISPSSAASDSVTPVATETRPKRSVNLNAAKSSASAARKLGAQIYQDQTRSMCFTQHELENGDEPSSNFFPAVRPSAFAQSKQGTLGAGTQPSQTRHLEKFYVNFLIQFVCTSLCIVFFAIFSGVLSTTWYSAWEANNLSPPLEKAILIVTWVTTILCGIVILAILDRTYESVFSNIGTMAQSRSGEGQSAPLSRTRSNDGSAVNRKPARRLSGAKRWAASTVSQLSSSGSRVSQDIGLEQVRSHRKPSRGESLSDVVRNSLHKYTELDGEQKPVDAERSPANEMEQPFELRQGYAPDVDVTTTISRFSSSHPNKGSADGVVVEQTVSTIIEDPSVEEEDPASMAHRSSSNSNVSEQHACPPYSPDGTLTKAGGSSVDSERSHSVAARSRANTSSGDRIGLGVALATSPPWTAPQEWGSGQPDSSLTK